MGYESKVYIVDRHSKDYADIIATIKLSTMCNGFTELFTEDIDYKIFAEDGNHDTDTDRYGDHIKSGNKEKIIEYLENLIESGETYSRVKPLLYLLRGFNSDKWKDLQILHYGY